MNSPKGGHSVEIEVSFGDYHAENVTFTEDTCNKVLIYVSNRP